jgi:hypothetical protein
MKRTIIIDERGYIDAADHQFATQHDADAIRNSAVVRFYFDVDTYVDIKFDSDYGRKGALQIRSMANKVPSMAVLPLSGNTILVVPGG